jgi:hypothetical protein
LIPDFSETESVIAMVVHHCMLDGQGFGAWFHNVFGDDDDISGLLTMPKLSFFNWFIIYMTAPFTVAYEITALLCGKDDHNLLRKGIPLSGKKVGAFSREINLAELKKAAKAQVCSVNDYLTALLS